MALGVQGVGNTEYGGRALRAVFLDWGRRIFDDDYAQLRKHLNNFIDAGNFSRRRKLPHCKGASPSAMDMLRKIRNRR